MPTPTATARLPNSGALSRAPCSHSLENCTEKPDLLMKKSLSNCRVSELKVLWTSPGSAEPLHCFSRMVLSAGPSHTFRTSWFVSVSNTTKCRLRREHSSA